MGVTAVPGSGKTLTLSALAAEIVSSGQLDEDQEVLIVTLVNSAVGNIAGRVGQMVEARGLLRGLGYRVRTLHGLSHDIVRERPGLVGLSDGFEIIDERQADRIRRDVAEAWLRANEGVLEAYLKPDLGERREAWVRREHWPALVSDVANSFIRRAKDTQATPQELRSRLERLLPQPLPLAEMGLAIYADYQRALNYRGAVDFDDLVRCALRALQLDAELVERLRSRWPVILEDEAQDSSELQEQILRLLSGPGGNWVRVGDPNQAIYETFTTASPRLLRGFLTETGVVHRDLPNSGRSTRSIMALANYLVAWTRSAHPVDGVRDSLAPAQIVATPPGDPQPNPPDDPTLVRIIDRKWTPAAELRAVVDSVARWLPHNPDKTVAILAPRNNRGFEFGRALKDRGVPHHEFLRSTQATRETAGALGNVVNYLADPSSPTKLARVYEVWRRDERGDEACQARLAFVTGALEHCRQVEDFLWPRAGQDWLTDLHIDEPFPEVREQIVAFRSLVRRWQEASVLPIDQLVLTVAQDLFDETTDLAVSHKLAVLLRRASEAHPDWRLPELTSELATIAKNERRFLGLGQDDSGFDPERYKGQVVVATAHKAKGLEWDRVYLTAVNNYNFPSAMAHDSFLAEKWFVRDGLNLEAETLAQLDALRSEDASYREGMATVEARREYAAERLRLLYVAITRARRELVITWNTGRRGESQPAVPFVALRTFWEQAQEEGE